MIVDTPTIKCWHLQDSLSSYSKSQLLLSFFECSEPTLNEYNIVKNNTKTLFSSRYAADIFQNAGLSNIGHFPLVFDSESFYKTNKKYYTDDRIVWGLLGKWEARKSHPKLLKLCASKYGNNPKHVLHCCLHNNFIDPNIQNQLIAQALDGKRYWNINFLPWAETNEGYNNNLNSIDIDLTGLSGAEGCGLPSFTLTGLGKWSIVMRHTGHLDWSTPDNSIQIEPAGTRINLR